MWNGQFWNLCVAATSFYITAPPALTWTRSMECIKLICPVTWGNDINKSKQGCMQNSFAEICQFVVAFSIPDDAIAMNQTRKEWNKIKINANRWSKDNEKGNSTTEKSMHNAHRIKIYTKIHKYHSDSDGVCDDDSKQWPSLRFKQKMHWHRNVIEKWIVYCSIGYWMAKSMLVDPSAHCSQNMYTKERNTFGKGTEDYKKLLRWLEPFFDILAIVWYIRIERLTFFFVLFASVSFRFFIRWIHEII